MKRNKTWQRDFGLRCGWNPTLASQETKGLCAEGRGAHHWSAQAMPWGRDTALVFLWPISSSYFFLIFTGEVILISAVIGRDQVLLRTWGALTSASSEGRVKSEVPRPLFFVPGVLLPVPLVIVLFPVPLGAIQQSPSPIFFVFSRWLCGKARGAARVLPPAKRRGLQSWGSLGFRLNLSSEVFCVKLAKSISFSPPSTFPGISLELLCWSTKKLFLLLLP